MKLRINLEECSYTHDMEIYQIEELIRFIKSNDVLLMDENGNDYALSEYIYYDSYQNIIDIAGNISDD